MKRGQLRHALAGERDPRRSRSARLAFQDRHRVAAFSQDAVGRERYRRGQLLNRSPELRDS